MVPTNAPSLNPTLSQQAINRISRRTTSHRGRYDTSQTTMNRYLKRSLLLVGSFLCLIGTGYLLLSSSLTSRNVYKPTVTKPKIGSALADERSRNGVYTYSDDHLEVEITVSASRWSGKTILKSGFGFSFDQQSPICNMGIVTGLVHGNDLYDSTGKAVGRVSAGSLYTRVRRPGFPPRSIWTCYI